MFLGLGLKSAGWGMSRRRFLGRGGAWRFRGGRFWMIWRGGARASTSGGGGFDGEAGPDVGVEAVFAVGLDGDAVDFAGGHEVSDVIDQGVGGAGGAAGASCGDDGCAALAYGFLEFGLEPFVVADDLRD